MMSGSRLTGPVLCWFYYCGGDFIIFRLFRSGFITAKGKLLFWGVLGADLITAWEAYFNFRAFFRIERGSIPIFGVPLKNGGK